MDKMDLSNKASLLRKKFGEDESSPIDIFKLAQTIENLTLIFYPLNENISGVCYKGNTSNLIIINSDMSVGRQRFSLAHEFYHLYYDESSMNSVSFIQIGKGGKDEERADQFASYFLVPQSSLYILIEDIKRSKKEKNITIEDVIRVEQYYGVSHKAMLYRLREEGYINSTQSKEMETGVIGIAGRLGYDTTIYYPSSEDKKMMVLGHYIAMTEKLLDKNLISQGKYEEFLLDAFRDDLVYGREGEDEVPFD